MPLTPRPYSLVTLREAARGSDYPFSADLPLVYLGEIPNMPGHCVVAGSESGRIYTGYHIETFVELSEDET